MLMYEVMSRGQLPYAEFATLAEVAEQIKAGFIMRCPTGCRTEVHKHVLLPCWKPARVRPGFTEMCDALIDLGASPENDEDDRGSAEQQKLSTSKLRKSIQAVENDKDAWAAAFTAKGRPFLGPSVHHIHKVLGPRVVAAVAPPWKDSRGQAVVPAASATIRDAVTVVVKPASAERICPRDLKKGCAYVDTLTSRDSVGSAIALLSYSWSTAVLSVGSALSRWAEQTERDPKRSYIWVCSLCLNQHRFSKIHTPEQLAQEFGPRVLAIGRVLPMLEPW